MGYNYKGSSLLPFWFQIWDFNLGRSRSSEAGGDNLGFAINNCTDLVEDASFTTMEVLKEMDAINISFGTTSQNVSILYYLVFPLSTCIYNPKLFIWFWMVIMGTRETHETLLLLKTILSISLWMKVLLRGLHSHQAGIRTG